MIKVSVVVPVFGVEKYIRRCALSLLSQSMDDIEFIFVNDCTNDNSIRILDEVIAEFPARRNNVRIVNHDKNKGLPAARETGVRLAKGEYIAHCDSDDWVDLDMYKVLYEFAKSNDADYVKCSHMITDGNSYSIVKVPFNNSKVMDKNTVISSLLTCKGWNSVWDSLVKRTLYTEDIEFASSAMLEDFHLSTQLLIKAQRIAFVSKPLYYYYQNPNSICGKNDDASYIRRSIQAKENILLIEDFIKCEYGPNLFKNELVALKFVPYRLIFPIMSRDNYVNWNSLFNDIKLSLMWSTHISFTEKIMFYLIECHLYRPILFLKEKIRRYIC